LVETESRIEIELPVEKEFARLLRLMVSGIASRMNFNLDAVDDLKIAVEEAFLIAMRRQVTGQVKVSFELMSDRLRIAFAGVGQGSGDEKQPEDFGNFILDAVVDEIEIGPAEENFGLTMTKYL